MFPGARARGGEALVRMLQLRISIFIYYVLLCRFNTKYNVFNANVKFSREKRKCFTVKKYIIKKIVEIYLIYTIKYVN